MNNTCKFACICLLGASFMATASTAPASSCCPAVTPLAAEAAADAKAKSYPLDTCIVSDEKLGEMGEPFVFTHEGQEIKLCCKSCKKKFDKSPETYLKKLDGAAAKK